VQRRPDLFSVLRVLVDRKGLTRGFLMLGSASGDLLQQSSETLAGRMETVMLRGFSLDELGNPAPTTGRPGTRRSTPAPWE
jgi:predicted AAA+ superfamily ATPase